MFDIGSKLLPWVLGALVLLGVWLFYKLFKPYSLDRSSPIQCAVGGNGSGKSHECIVKCGVPAIKRNRRHWWIVKHFMPWRDAGDAPCLYCNIPVKIKYYRPLTRDILLERVSIPQGSVVIIDELPKFLNQYGWDKQAVQKNLDDFMTFFRHYVDGLLIINAQSIDEVEVHIRRKLNSYYWFTDFHKFLCFYSVKVLRCRVADGSVTNSADMLSDTMRVHYGFMGRKYYDTRCYSRRYSYLPAVDNGSVDDELVPVDLKQDEILRIDDSMSCDLDAVIKAKKGSK